MRLLKLLMSLNKYSDFFYLQLNELISTYLILLVCLSTAYTILTSSISIRSPSAHRSEKKSQLRKAKLRKQIAKSHMRNPIAKANCEFAIEDHPKHIFQIFLNIKVKSPKYKVILQI